MTEVHGWLDQLFVRDTTIAHLILAMLLGGINGIERQWRQRSAGLRTNVLVCIGAASFVDLAGAIVPGTTGVTQVVAFVVSGVGFLGAGAIMREGATVRGLATAATVWCSAAVGAAAGAGDVNAALATAVAVMFVNVMVRPIVELLENYKARRAGGGHESCGLTVICETAAAPRIRALILERLMTADIQPTSLISADSGDRDGYQEVRAEMMAPSDSLEEVLEQVLGSFAADPMVLSARWHRDRNQSHDF